MRLAARCCAVKRLPRKILAADMAGPILKPLGFDYVESLLTPVSGASVTVTLSVNALGLVAGGRGLDCTRQVHAGIVSITMAGGEHGEQYDVTLEFISPNGDLTQRVIRVAVIDDAWAMPDGSAGWLGLIDFIQKFGFAETLAATDPDGSGIIDRRFLVNALRDAQAECAANIPPHYAQPLSAVPDILKTALADLTRARLYPRGVPDGVESAARAQRQLLSRIATGAVALPGVAGVAITPAEISDAPIVFHSQGRAYPDGLREY